MLHTDTFAVFGLTDPSVKGRCARSSRLQARTAWSASPVSRDVNNVRNDNARVYHVPVVSSVPITPIDGLAAVAGPEGRRYVRRRPPGRAGPIP